MANTHPTTSQSCFGKKAKNRINRLLVIDLGLALMLIWEDRPQVQRTLHVLKRKRSNKWVAFYYSSPSTEVKLTTPT
jgi:hypothetical protein